MKVYARKSNATVALNKILQNYEELILQAKVQPLEEGFVVMVEFSGETPKDCKQIVARFDSSQTLGANVARMEEEVGAAEEEVPAEAEELPAAEEEEVPEAEELPAELSDAELAEMQKAADAQANMTEIVDSPTPPPSTAGTVVRKSGAVRPCKLVWEIASANPGLARKEVVAMAVAQGVATNTARTQYQAWFSTINKQGK